jgi:hypothetical protein
MSIKVRVALHDIHSWSDSLKPPDMPSPFPAYLLDKSPAERIQIIKF